VQLRREIELLAPARNLEIGIAATDCGADSLYIAGPAFGAREAAGNSIKDIEQLTKYASRFGTKVYLVLNTILYDNEIREAERIAREAWEAGCSALIIQDLGLLKADMPPLPLFASTQTNIRSVEQARILEALGFSRLILARELSLKQIEEIRASTNVELESFIHGALCVSYSGQCYISERIAGRSANRGACVQACRSRYSLEDSKGNILIKDKPLLSLKDLNLGEYIPQLVSAGVSSFKVEGRLKNISYIKNVVRYYRSLIDKYLELDDTFSASSYGRLYGGFTPRPENTFNRGYTNLFVDGKRGEWNSGEIAKASGELVGRVKRIFPEGASSSKIELDSFVRLENGDGICFTDSKGEVLGTRVNVASPGSITINDRPEITPGTNIYRNYNRLFEKELENNMPRRLIDVKIDIEAGLSALVATAKCEDGISAQIEMSGPFEAAKNNDRARDTIINQLSKSWGVYLFKAELKESKDLPFMQTSLLNGVRRDLADKLDKLRDEKWSISLSQSSKMDKNNEPKSGFPTPFAGQRLSYLVNSSNSLSDKLYKELGADSVQRAFEIEPPAEVELMRCKYCIKYEIGKCPAEGFKGKMDEPLYLANGGRRFRLGFDCGKCEMVIFG
jgi:putative protease